MPPIRLGEASTDEMKALLAELEDVGGNVSGDARPYSRHRRGTVGTTNVLGEQSNRLTCSRLPVGNNNSKATPAAAATKAEAGFSTYAPAVSTGDKDSARRQMATPMGVRLVPLGGPGGAGKGGAAELRPTPPPPGPGGRPVSPRAAAGFNSMPALSGGAVSAPPVLPPAPAVGAPTTAGGKATTGGLVQRAPPPPDAYINNAPGEREANFLPIMCARYLSPSGLAPTPRWGHTLTGVGSSALFMFGGMGLDGVETNTFCEFDVGSIAWEPVFVAAGTTPMARHSHAACAYEDRYLVVHGGVSQNGTRLLGDLNMFDIHTQEWKCLWSADRAVSQVAKNEPAPRFGHTVVIRDDRLYVFGGKVQKSSSGTTTANNDIYVFSLSSGKWRKRIRSKQSAAGGNNGDAAAADTTTTAATAMPTAPAGRSYHAACIKGDIMFINGGTDNSGTLQSDTWQIDLTASGGGAWSCLHYGGSADAIPRERHDMFVCGEAVMLVGGCNASMFNANIAAKFNNFVSILPLMGQAAPCWIPVAMGNVSIVAPQKRGFGAALSGSFVYIFGGTCGTEAATNTMIRFLAADGYVSADARATTAANDEALRSLMQRVRDRALVPYDIHTIAGVVGATGDASSQIGFHRAIIQQRAPKFWAALQECRNEPLPSKSGAAPSSTKTNGAASNNNNNNHNNSNVVGDEVDTFLQQEARRKSNDNTKNAPASGTASLGVPTLYYTDGNTRVKGLTHSLSTEALSCLASYLYSGGLRAEFRLLLEEEEEKEEGEGTAVCKSSSSGPRQQLTKVLQALQTAAADYDLAPLGEMAAALLAGNRKQLHKAREHSTAVLRNDLSALLDDGHNATVTVLFVDPHTKQQSAHALHPMILMSASSFFADLLRPLYTGERTSFQIGTVAAKITGSGPLIGGNSKRAVLVGPVSVPTLAVQPILRFLYTQQLRVPREVALNTMMGAHQLGLATLQAYCESIVAREEVNYDSCCSFYYLSRKYAASLLQEMSLLTAVSGYAQVRTQQAFIGLSPEDRRSIESVAEELGSSNWVPPPQPAQEMKPAASYAARWNASSS